MSKKMCVGQEEPEQWAWQLARDVLCVGLRALAGRMSGQRTGLEITGT